MEDERIVELYWERDEDAISETAVKYGNYLTGISYGILADRADAQECVNDTYHHAWQAMPPQRPAVLSAFLGKITRRISIDCWRKRHAAKRGGGEMLLVLDELEECVAGTAEVEKEMEQKELACTIDSFLEELPDTERRVFMCRYWYMESIAAISERFGFSQSKVKSMLHRTRGKLRVRLVKEGY